MSVASVLGTATATADGLMDRRNVASERHLSRRELRTELAFAALLLAVAVAMVVALPSPRSLEPVSAVLLLGAYALLARVKFQLGPGLVGPTELVFVPMLFLLPTPAVPLFVAGGTILCELPDVLRRRAGLVRIPMAVADAWYAVGPALLITLLAPAEVSAAAWAVYVLALAAQFAGDLVVSVLREWIGAGVSPGSLLQVLALFYLVDLLLAPIGLLAVLASAAHPYAYVLALPPAALLALIARERGKRIERELELARAHRRAADQLERAHRRVGEAVAATLDREALHQLLLGATIEAVGADCGRFCARADDGSLVTTLVIGDPDGRTDAMDAAEAAAARIAEHGPWQTAIGDATALAVALDSPSRDARGRGRDALVIARTGAAFSPAERELLDHLARQAAVSLENLELHEHIQQQAATDELTGLLNHRHLHQVLDQTLLDAQRTRQPVAVIMLDIDNFKRINDTHGHKQGDRVLAEVAGALCAASRPLDQAGRYGGEELALVLPGTTLAEAHAVAERIREAIAGLSFLTGAGESFGVTASIGVAASPLCAEDREALIEAADAAMYVAKNGGKNRTAIAPGSGRFERRVPVSGDAASEVGAA